MSNAAEIPIGITADELRELDGRDKRYFLRKPRNKGVEERGATPATDKLIVHWYYRDCTVELRWRTKGGISAYRVVEVRPTKAARRAQRYQQLKAAEARGE